MTVRVLLFAYLRERAGGRETTVEVPEGASVADVWAVLCRRHESFAGTRPRFALSQVYVDNAQTLHENDELAVIPPVSGGVGADPGADSSMYRIVDEQIDCAAVLAAVGSPAAGGSVLFVGTTREVNDGKRVERLEYEAYRDMAVAEMARIGADIARRWPVVKVAMVHRVGVVPLGEASVAVAVSAAHREAAFAACRHGIDTLKAAVPIWKKEHFEGGERWIGACDDHGAASRREGVR
jgi:molybdopterin synthase catalytic subunit